MVNRSQVTVRAASSEDFDFLYDLHRAAMQDYVAQTWGWDEAWQRNYFRQRFNPEECKIIMLGPENVGVVSVLHRETEWLLNNIEVLPRSQNQGIGTTVIKSILAEASGSDRPVSLQVLKVNPARNWYKRLGFLTTGESATHYLMKATPKDKYKA